MPKLKALPPYTRILLSDAQCIQPVTHPMAQVQSYLRFAKTKREENAREVDLTFDDVRHYKLQVNPKP